MLKSFDYQAVCFTFSLNIFYFSHIYKDKHFKLQSYKIMVKKGWAISS